MHKALYSSISSPLGMFIVYKVLSINALKSCIVFYSVFLRKENLVLSVSDICVCFHVVDIFLWFSSILADELVCKRLI